MSEFVVHYVRQVFRENARSATTDSSCNRELNFNPKPTQIAPDARSIAYFLGLYLYHYKYVASYKDRRSVRRGMQ
jgi:hypothetical protein